MDKQIKDIHYAKVYKTKIKKIKKNYEIIFIVRN